MFGTIDDVTQPLPAPRFSVSETVPPRLPQEPGSDGREIGLASDAIDRLLGSRA